MLYNFSLNYIETVTMNSVEFYTHKADIPFVSYYDHPNGLFSCIAYKHILFLMFQVMTYSQHYIKYMIFAKAKIRIGS